VVEAHAAIRMLAADAVIIDSIITSFAILVPPASTYNSSLLSAVASRAPLAQRHRLSQSAKRHRQRRGPSRACCLVGIGDACVAGVAIMDEQNETSA